MIDDKARTKKENQRREASRTRMDRRLDPSLTAKKRIENVGEPLNHDESPLNFF